MITVIGSGSWGSALASVLVHNNNSICMCGREPSILNDLKNNSKNQHYLGDIQLFNNPDITVTTAENISQAITKNTKHIVVAVPSEAFSAVIKELNMVFKNLNLSDYPAIIYATKGLGETANGEPLWLHEIIEQELGRDYPYCILSGPSFAKEVALKQPTSVVMAAQDIKLATKLSKLFHNKYFRVYTGQDVLGVELGGALKNILAFAVGCGEGYGFGCNARAAVITRGLHEMLRLGDVLGVKHDTLMGLSGLGDLVLTATDNQSRNKRFGNSIGQGVDIKTAISKVGQHVASYDTTRLIYKLIQKNKLDMPLSEQSYKVLFDGISVEQAIANLAARPQKAE